MDSVTKSTEFIEHRYEVGQKNKWCGRSDKIVWQKNCILSGNRGKMAAATKGTEGFAFEPTMFALHGIIQNYVIAKDFVTLFQDGLPRYDWNIGFMDRHNLTLEWGTNEGSAQSEFPLLHN